MHVREHARYWTIGDLVTMTGNLDRSMAVICLVSMFVMQGCTTHFNLPPGAIGNVGKYNYSPSVIEQGRTRQFWWCSRGRNPNDSSMDTDAIFYASMNLSTGVVSSPVLVLAESPGTWDGAYTCNPKVIGGVFDNPLGDGKTYTYAMYYVATSLVSGTKNSIGVAFSTDGIHWNKYPNPVIPTSSPEGDNGYGVGQPALYNSDHKSRLTMFYEDDYPVTHHVVAVSSDGVHFTAQGTMTVAGLDSDDPNALWGDMSYDPQSRVWYAVFNRPGRPSATTGNVLEYGQYGIELYRIPSDAILTGSAPWQQLAIMDTNSTGFEANFIAGFVRDMWGNLNVASYPKIELYVSVSYPVPNWDATPTEAGNSGQLQNWIVYPMIWNPATSDAALPLNRYFNGTVHEVTTGWINPMGKFKLEGLLGHLDPNPSRGASLPFYSCKARTSDYFISHDVGCEGELVLGKEGYGYSKPVAGRQLVALYRCSTGTDHFVSKDPGCEGQKNDALLGYVTP